VAVVAGVDTGVGQGIELAPTGGSAGLAAIGRIPDVKARALGDRAVMVPTDLPTIAPDDVVVDHLVREPAGLDTSSTMPLSSGAPTWSPSARRAVTQRSTPISTRCPSSARPPAGQHMIARGGGKVVSIPSMLSVQGCIRVSRYIAPKSGVPGLTQLLANEQATKGVDVNTIVLGHIATGNTAALQDDQACHRQILERIRTGRWGDVSGHILAVNSGWRAC
jgi:2-deoxy-D-gluconate 3-dehydrogenase